MTQTESIAMPLTRPENAPPSFHVMAKPTGAICNLDCSYCFFLSKEALYPGSPFRMKDDVLDAYIRQVLESQTAPEVTIAWQGGEPTLMGLEFFQQMVVLAQKYVRPGQTINHTMQTNGTLLNDAWCEFLKEYDFLVGLSVDGTQEMHDANRVDKGGAPTFNKVMAGADFLKKHEVDFNILCTVHAANADQPLKVYRFFRDELGVAFIQFIPIIERATPELLPEANLGWGDSHAERPLYIQSGSLVTHRSIQPKQWGKFLIAIFNEWVRRDVGKIFVQLFDSSLGAWIGQGASLCIHRETCGDALALEHNGDLYSCDHFVEPDYLLGNIKQDHMIELVASDQQRKFGQDKFDSLPQYCLDCEVKFACNGGCPRNRFITTPDGEPGLNYLCAGYKAFFKHIDYPMKIMADLLRRGHYADEVMGVLAQQEAAFKTAVAKAGRNGQCPCGSGKKVKQCHGRK